MPYCVYVIELHPDVLAIQRFRRANPGHRDGKPCVYVGSTSLSPEARFAQRKAGVKHNRYARKYGVRLCLGQMKHLQDLETRDQAEREEVALANRLRRRGYAAWQG